MSELTDKAVALLAYLDKNSREQGDDVRPTVTALLAQSRAQHEVYRRALRHRENGVLIDGNPVAAAEAVAKTARLRAQAEVLDPQHLDPAWQDELVSTKFPHTAMLAFYEAEVKYYVPEIHVPPPPPPPDDDTDDEEVKTDGQGQETAQILARETVQKGPRLHGHRARAVQAGTRGRRKTT